MYEEKKHYSAATMCTGRSRELLESHFSLSLRLLKPDTCCEGSDERQQVTGPLKIELSFLLTSPFCCTKKKSK